MAYIEPVRKTNIKRNRKQRRPSANQKNMNYIEKLNQVLADPSASYWLKKALRALDGRDPIDALNDVHALHEIATERWGEIAKQHKQT